ncbi:MAG: DUF1062 domain-containing protein [Alphaproteobacteria bacterium]|nr:DUF1062 domain-containing protein [Alphaproteobacteria bacterium]
MNRRCPRCDLVRAHTFSGRARLNANGRHLDAWLLYTCAHCSRTAKVPVLERAPVRSVDRALLLGLESNDPAVLGPLCARLVGGDAFSVRGDDLPSGGVVVLHVAAGLSVRLDRVLARGLGCSRAEVSRRCPDAPLRRSAADGQRVRVLPRACNETTRSDGVVPAYGTSRSPR